jgi:hypothetical protein
LSAAAAVPIYLTTPLRIFSALLSLTDEFHECPFQEPRRLETQEFSWESVFITARHRHPHRPAAADVVVASGLELEQLVAPHEPTKPAGPPALVLVRAVWRPRSPQQRPTRPSREPSAAHQHGCAWRIPASAAAAHGLPSAGRASWLSPAAARGPVWRLRCAAAEPRRSHGPACAAVQTAGHGRSRGRRPLQGAADCRHRFCECRPVAGTCGAAADHALGHYLFRRRLRLCDQH